MNKAVLKSIGAVALMCGMVPGGFGQSLVTIGDYILRRNVLVGYQGCDSMANIPGNLGITAIADEAFYQKGITGVIIPFGVTAIGKWAFYNCDSLTSVTIPSSVAAIGDGAFQECSNLTSLAIPASVSFIGNGALAICQKLTSISVAGGNAEYRSVDGLLFDKSGKTLIQCPGGKSGVYIIPESVSAIGEGAFWGCSGLTNVIIPAGAVSIGDYAFFRCTGLTNVTIPSGVTLIGTGAFRACYELTSVTIPPSVVSIGDEAFDACRKLKAVILSRKTRVGSEAFPSGVQIIYID
ncbi:MAG: leucine-rich repeat domain-containing protein [Spirochaetaceae bacterium]|jgi:hypothetical protein|nr:leucine-rich repeat domain-containing protein [Spirochaetaceae bacterium]